MPAWAVGIIVGTVAATGGYILRTLIRISQTLGKIDAGFSDHGNRISRLERQQDDRNSWQSRGHL